MGGWWFIPPVSDYSEWFNTDPFQLLERLAGFVDWQRRPYQRFEGSTHKILENPWFWVPLSMEIPIEGYYFLVSSTRAWSQQHGPAAQIRSGGKRSGWGGNGQGHDRCHGCEIEALVDEWLLIPLVYASWAFNEWVLFDCKWEIFDHWCMFDWWLTSS